MIFIVGNSDRLCMLRIRSLDECVFESTDKLSRLKTPLFHVPSHPIPFIEIGSHSRSSLFISTRTAQATQKIPNSIPTREPVPYQNQGPHAPTTTPPHPTPPSKTAFTARDHVMSRLWHGRGETFSYHYASMLFVHKMMLVRPLIPTPRRLRSRTHSHTYAHAHGFPSSWAGLSVGVAGG